MVNIKLKSQDPTSVKLTVGSFYASNDDSVIHIDTVSNWNAQEDLVGKLGDVYVYSDYEELNGKNVPGIKIGDGKTRLIDTAFVSSDSQLLVDHVNNSQIHVSENEKNLWNDKVTAFQSKEDSEMLVLTKLSEKDYKEEN